MAPKDEQWIPKLIRPPEKDPEGRTFFDWNDEKLKKWKADAIKMQEAHVRDNSRTEWFEYKPEERDAIELRILVTLYGIRTPVDGTKGVPSCPLKTYDRDQKLHARRIKKVIVKNCGSSEKIHFNVIYISTATKSEDKDEFLATEEPVFVVEKCRRFVDRDGNAYDNFDEYRQNNRLPRGPMLFPQNGNYTPGNNGGNGVGGNGGDDGNGGGGGGNGGDGDDRVPLVSGETPASSAFKRIKDVADTIVMVGGIALAVAGVVIFCAPAAFSAMAIAAMQTGSFLLAAYTTAGAIYGIYDKTSRDESIRTEILLLISSALSSYTGFLRMKVGQYAREGKTYTEVLNKITRIQKNLFAAFNLITFVSSASSLLSSFVDLWNKKERTWLDYYQICMSLFMSVNVLTKPITIQGVFESEQLQYLNQIQKSLQSEEAKQEMSSMITQHSAPGQRAYLIRNLKKIENQTEFFELIKKTGSVVTCTPDGLIVDGKLPISPERYNEIGKAVFQDKLTQITRYPETALHKSLLDTFFGGDYPSGSENELEERLNEITKLPVGKRKEAMRLLVKEFSGDARATGQAFEESWVEADKAFKTGMNNQIKTDMEKQINKLINNLKQGSNETEQREDFDKLKALATKKINGTITSEEKQELQQQIDKCSRHRKQYFFQSSANHRNDENYDEKMNTLEKDVAGGKSLEEWKMAQRDFEKAYPNESDQNEEYKQRKAEIDKGIKQAEYVRDFRSKADAFVDPTSDNTSGSRLKQTFIDECQKALEEARKTGNADAIANADEKLIIAQEIGTKLDTNVLENTQSFKRDIWTFTNAQNERLCYYVDMDKVKSDLQHIYGHPNVEDIIVNGKNIYANMKIGDYDRLNRVLKQYSPNGKEFMTAATNIASNPVFAEHVKTAQDIVSIAEAIDKHMGNPDESRRQEYLNNLASKNSQDYRNFCQAFSEKIEEVKALSSSIRSQWSSLLSMAYHGWKHEDDIAIKNVTIAKYFTEYANKLFNPENMTVQAHTQSGNFAETYMQSFGKRIHVGFTVGPNRTRTSFFGKKDTC